MFDHSEECTVLLAELWSSRTALAMGSSWSPFRLPLRMSDRIFYSTPASSTPSRVHTTRNSGRRRTMFSLSEAPFP